MKRKKLSRGLDKHIFKRTAIRTKKVNVAPITARGGIRL